MPVAIDGARPWNRFWYVTWPLLLPVTMVVMLFSVIQTFADFQLVYVMTGGGPGSTNVPYFVYDESIGGGFRYGSASAYAIVVVIASIIIATFSLRVLSGLLKDEDRA